MSLGDWHKRLETHFTRLRLDRARAIGETPLFALEHGLTDAELGALSSALRKDVETRDPSPNHWLAWVVYASEMGYRYDGDEYWQTFERRTPDWRLAYRHLIRTWFLKFHSDFGGAKPVGAWAEHFNIICWPIMHAILPVDLQQQLAHILWSMSTVFRAEYFESPELLGKQIAARSWSASQRFQNLAQEPLLLGQIATALLLPERPMFKHLLLPATLQRIATDLGKEAAARRWLQEARHSAQKLRISGLRPLTTRGSASREPLLPSIEAPGLEPEIFLRPTPAGPWEVVLELPNFTSLASNYPELGAVLANAKCVVTGGPARPLARGRLLSERQTVVLRRWPSDDVILRFEPTTELLNVVVAGNCRLRPGPVWLFRLVSDGLARWIRNRSVRPLADYLVLSTEQLQPPTELGVEAQIQCDGIRAARISIPAVLDEITLKYLEHLSLSPVRHFEIHPVGLVPAYWDGEGRLETLCTDPISLAVHLDHVPDSLAIAVDEGPSEPVSLRVLSEQEPLYLQVAGVDVGLHKLTLSLRHTAASGTISGVLELLVREPRSWSPSDGEYRGAAFRVEVDPLRPSLEDLWDGTAAIELIGPPDHQAAVSIRFFEREGQPPLFIRQLGPLNIPATAEQVSHALDRLRRDRDAQDAYDRARWGQITIDAPPFGTRVLRVDRLYTPLRWIYGPGRTLYLINDTARSARVFLYHFAVPDKGLLVESDFATETAVPDPGGLYEAEAGEFRASMIVPPIVSGLKDFFIQARLERRGSPQVQLTDFLGVLEKWQAAHVTGEPRSRHIRREILNVTLAELLRTACGAAWVDCERRFHETGDVASLLERVTDHSALRALLEDDVLSRKSDLAQDPPVDRVFPLARVLSRVIRFESGPWQQDARGRPYKLPPPRSEQPGWMAEFALRFASDPAGLRAWGRGDLGTGLQGLLKRPALARAARLLVLVLDQPSTHSTMLHPNWQW